MNEIKIKIRDGISDNEAIKRIKEVIDMGFISNNNTQYCYATLFQGDVTVYCDKSKAGKHIFTVYKEKA